jgi:uncharacterized integral membrane protein (TIGR00697 family)
LPGEPALTFWPTSTSSGPARRRQLLYLWLAGLFVAALVVADLIGGKLFRVAGRDLSCGMLAFPITFVLTDVLNEFYGSRLTKRVTYLGLGAAALAFLVIFAALRLPASPESPLSSADFNKVFGLSARLYIASLTAYILGQLMDIAVFASLRRLTGERYLWLRATGSTLVSQAIDTAVVSVVFYLGLKSWDFHRPDGDHLLPDEVRHRGRNDAGHLCRPCPGAAGHQGRRSVRGAWRRGRHRVDWYT